LDNEPRVWKGKGGDMREGLEKESQLQARGGRVPCSIADGEGSLENKRGKKGSSFSKKLVTGHRVEHGRAHRGAVRERRGVRCTFRPERPFIKLEQQKKEKKGDTLVDYGKKKEGKEVVRPPALTTTAGQNRN